MKEESGGNLVVTASLALNVALVAMIFWLGYHNSRILMQSYIDAARQRASIQQTILDKLESGGGQNLEAIKEQLQVGIDVELRVAYKLETGVKPPSRK